MLSSLKIYGKDDCQGCLAVKRWLDRRNIPYEAFNIVEDKQAMREALDTGYYQLPILVYGADSWFGFDPSKMEEVEKDYKG